LESLRQALAGALAGLKDKPLDSLLNARYARLMGYGKFKETRAR
jgi:acetyl-CoA carboxylase carboxyl transferase subunit alpha